MTKEQLLSLWNADNWEVNELRGLLYGAPGGEGTAYQLQ